MFGKHLILDCDEMNINMESMEEIQKFIDELVIDVLKMKKVGKTHYEYFEDSYYNRIRGIVGYSVVQVISLSSIVLHLNDIPKSGFIDIFTCGDIKAGEVIACVNKYFSPQKIHSRLISRCEKQGSLDIKLES